MKILATVAVTLSLGLFACGKGGEGSAATPESLCAHVKKIAEAEGGEALETYKKRLEKDCAKEVGEAKAEIGDEGFPKFAACVMGKQKFSEVMDGCNPRDFKPKKKDAPKDEPKKPEGK